MNSFDTLLCMGFGRPVTLNEHNVREHAFQLLLETREIPDSDSCYFLVALAELTKASPGSWPP